MSDMEEELRLLEAEVAQSQGVDRATALTDLARYAHYLDRWDIVLAAADAAADLLEPGQFPELEAEALQMSACALLEAKRYEEALERLKAISLDAQSPKLLAYNEKLEADCLIGLERPIEAVELLTSAQNRFLELDDLESAAECEHEMGDALFDIDPSRAMDHLRTARGSLLAIGLLPDAARCAVSIAAIFDDQGKHEEALGHLQDASAMYEASEEKVNAALTRGECARLMTQLGRPEEALEIHTSIKEVLEKAEIPEAIARNEMNHGIALLALGRTQEGERRLHAARRTYRDRRFLIDAAECDELLGMSLHSRGAHAKALVHLRRAKAIYLPNGLDAEAASSARIAGDCLSVMGKTREAAKHYGDASSIHSRIEEPVESAWCDAERAAALAALRRREEAQAALDTALEVLDPKLLPPEKASRLSMLIARVELVTRGNTSALQRIEQALAYAQASDDPSATANVEELVANLFLSAQWWPEAMPHLNAAIESYEKAGMQADADRLRSRMRIHLN